MSKQTTRRKKAARPMTPLEKRASAFILRKRWCGLRTFDEKLTRDLFMAGYQAGQRDIRKLMRGFI